MGVSAFTPACSRLRSCLPTPHGMRCPTCRTRHLVVIEIRVSGEPITMHSCSYCDQRWWQGMDGSLTLTSVLDLAATT